MLNATMITSRTPPIHRSLTAAWLRRHHTGRCGIPGGWSDSAVPMSAAAVTSPPDLGAGDVTDQVLAGQLVVGERGGHLSQPQHHTRSQTASTSGI